MTFRSLQLADGGFSDVTPQDSSSSYVLSLTRKCIHALGSVYLENPITHMTIKCLHFFFLFICISERQSKRDIKGNHKQRERLAFELLVCYQMVTTTLDPSRSQSPSCPSQSPQEAQAHPSLPSRASRHGIGSEEKHVGLVRATLMKWFQAVA